MRKYSFIVTFIDGRTEKVTAFSNGEAAILACAIRIHSGKSIRMTEIVCLDNGNRIINKQLQLR